MDAEQLYVISFLVAGIGVVIIGLVVWFGSNLVGEDIKEFFNLERFIDFWSQKNIRPNLPRYFVDSLSEALQRRNEFWTYYGQLVLSILIVVILAILLLAKIVTAEAGLPLLSAVSGFAVAKGTNSSRTITQSPDKEQE